jgi:predicted nuclease of predicted toxin-antitoxin system
MSEEYKLYLDQMFRVDVAQALREEGYDVLRASEIQQNRANDQQIFQRAITENRILVTLDEHFGDWVVLPISQHLGVIRIRVHPTTSEKVLNVLLPFLRMHTQEQLKDHLVILSEKRAKWILTA